MVSLARFDIDVDGVKYLVKRGTWQEGKVRRQAEFAQLGNEDLHSRVDRREFWQTSWLGGSEWEQPVYSSRNIDTYYKSSDLTFTDRAGSVMESKSLEQNSSGFGDPESKVAAWTGDGADGAISISYGANDWEWRKWDGVSKTWQSGVAADNNFPGAFIMAISPGVDRIYALFSGSNIAWYDPATDEVGVIFSGTGPVLNGAAMWVDRDYVWVYNSNRLFRYAIASDYPEELMIDDDWGFDKFSVDANFTGTVTIPKWSCTRALTSSEGIFYVKNIVEGGNVVAKVYRVDRDGSGTYINTPLGTLPKGQVAINLAHHLGSLLISTIGNYYSALQNVDDHRVTIYHITSSSIGAIGSPLGGTDVDETPVWFLGTLNEQLYIGGRMRLWQYDARIGAFHTYRSQADQVVPFAGNGSGFTQMVTVKLGTGSGTMFWHTSLDGTADAPYQLLVSDDTATTTLEDDAFVESNWIDFDLPMEQKSVTEIFYDMLDLRDGSVLRIMLLADDGNFATVATLTGGVDDNVGRLSIPPVDGYKFRYRLEFDADVDVSSPQPSRLLSLGFSSISGEMVDVMQFTIDGDETVNVENLPQVPVNVYDTLALLQDKAVSVPVTHWMRSDDGSDSVTKQMKIVSIVASKEWAGEGSYDVTLLGV